MAIKSENFRPRWISLIGEIEADLIERLPEVFPNTPDGLRDCRGFPFNITYARATYQGKLFQACDFSGALFNKCNLMQMRFERGIFKNCDFLEIRLWDCTFTDCVFEQCIFDNDQLGINCQYLRCSYLGCRFKARGARRTLFGHDSTYTHCTFTQCKFNRINLESCLFDQCDFDSQFMQVAFHGADRIQVYTGASAIAFKNCDLGSSVFKKCVVDADITSVGTRWPAGVWNG